VRIAFVMLGAPRRHPLWLPVADRLARRGAQVEFLWPDDGRTDLGRVRVEHDLYVLKCGSGLGLSLAGALHALGGATLNPYPVVAVCRDKVITSAVLTAAGVPVPDAWVMGDVSEARELLEDGPVIIKPQRGSRGAGVRVLWSSSELGSLEPETGPVVVQRYHAPDGLDNKLYVIGGRLFGVRRVWPARTLEDKLGEYGRHGRWRTSSASRSFPGRTCVSLRGRARRRLGSTRLGSTWSTAAETRW
jgi:glutathione synthase/RimK-type ligase-like ATP-grasp enzyme